MRAFLPAVVLLFAIFAGAKAISSPRGLCLEKNLFLQKLSKSSIHKVQVFKFPRMGIHTKCENKWNAYGSCCEVQSLVEYAIKDREQIHNNMTKVKSGILEIFNQLRSLIGVLDTVRQLQRPDLQSLRDRIEEVQRNNPHLVASNINASIAVLNSTDVASCSDELSRVRGSALCTICSGNSQFSFLGGKAVLSTDVCLGLYSKCEFQIAGPTIFLGLLMKDLEAINNWNSNSLGQKIDHSKSNSKGQKSGKITKQIQSMALMLKNSQHSLADKVRFCENLLRLVDKPFFFKIHSEHGKILDLIRTIEKKFKKIQKNPKTILQTPTSNKPKSNYRSAPIDSNFNSGFLKLNKETLSPLAQSAMPQFEQPNSFGGDFMITPANPQANTDSAYTSFLGATGSNHNEALIHNLRPMNLTSRFP